MALVRTLKIFIVAQHDNIHASCSAAIILQEAMDIINTFHCVSSITLAEVETDHMHLCEWKSQNDRQPARSASPLGAELLMIPSSSILSGKYTTCM